MRTPRKGKRKHKNISLFISHQKKEIFMHEKQLYPVKDHEAINLIDSLIDQGYTNVVKNVFNERTPPSSGQRLLTALESSSYCTPDTKRTADALIGVTCPCCGDKNAEIQANIPMRVICHRPGCNGETKTILESYGLIPPFPEFLPAHPTHISIEVFEHFVELTIEWPNETAEKLALHGLFSFYSGR